MTDRTFNILRISLFSTLIVWGVYTFIAYLAVPVHQAVLLSEAGRQAVAAACPGGGMLCQGVAAFFPFVGQTFSWAEPFLWYGIWSIIGLAALVGMGFLRTGEARIGFTLAPWKIILAFIASLWLTFTVISSGNNGDQPYNQLVEPLPQIYSGDAEGLRVLQENFKALMDKGCLTEIGVIQESGVRAYEISGLCTQGAFFTHVLPHVVMVLVLLFVFLTLGRFLLSLLWKNREPDPIIESFFSVVLGACGLVFILWLFAYVGSLLGQPIYSKVAGWAILVAIPAALYRHARYWIETLWKKQWSYEGMVYTGALIIGWLLISYLALNFLNVVRPFPIGWDDLGKYVNMPRLMVSYGFLIPQMGSYQWEFITSLGFLLFGYESVFGATAAMMFNWTAGLIAVCSVYVFGRLYLGPKHGLLAALLYYTLPLVGHFSYADMKVDNAVFALGAATMLAVSLAMFPPSSAFEEEPADEPTALIDWRWMVLAGVLGAFAFSFKVTSIMTLMALGTLIFGARVHWSAFVGTVSLAWAIFTYQNRFNLTDIGNRVYGDPTILNRPIILGALVILGIGLTAYSAYLHWNRFRNTSIAAGVFIGSFIITLAPFLLANNLAYGNVAPKLLFSQPNRLSPSFVIGEQSSTTTDFGQDIRSLPQELRVDETKCVGTAKTEELDRYWGYHTGWEHYLTLPWRSVMNIDSAGYYVTLIPALLLFPLLLLVPYFWMKQGRWLRWAFIATSFMVVQWVFFANGIAWYGIGMFLGLVIALEALVYRAPDLACKIAAGVLIAFSLMTAYSQRFWQFNQQRNLFEYPFGKVSYEAMRERTIPYYDDIREMIEQRRTEMPERPYVYRIGTFIPYFIPRNLEILPIADHQLDFFNCLNQERNPQLTLQRLQALGFNSMIFDTNTHTIEADPKGSLHQKVQQFVDFVNTPGLGLSLPVNAPDNGIVYITLP
jgi:hypothetical protein